MNLFTRTSFLFAKLRICLYEFMRVFSMLRCEWPVLYFASKTGFTLLYVIHRCRYFGMFSQHYLTKYLCGFKTSSSRRNNSLPAEETSNYTSVTFFMCNYEHKYEQCKQNLNQRFKDAESISVKTVKAYLHCCCNRFFFYRLSKMDLY